MYIKVTSLWLIFPGLLAQCRKSTQRVDQNIAYGGVLNETKSKPCETVVNLDIITKVCSYCTIL